MVYTLGSKREKGLRVSYVLNIFTSILCNPENKSLNSCFQSHNFACVNPFTAGIRWDFTNAKEVLVP